MGRHVRKVWAPVAQYVDADEELVWDSRARSQVLGAHGEDGRLFLTDRKMLYLQTARVIAINYCDITNVQVWPYRGKLALLTIKVGSRTTTILTGEETARRLDRLVAASREEPPG